MTRISTRMGADGNEIDSAFIRAEIRVIRVLAFDLLNPIFRFRHRILHWKEYVMFGTIRLGKLFGIDLFVHGTFWLLPLFVVFNSMLAGDPFGASFEVVVLFAIFGCIALHEAGHALAARAYGIGTRDITLYPMGGIASLERMPERPGREIAIALAGPAVNLLIVLVIVAGAMLGEVVLPGLWSAPDVGLLERFLGNLLFANAFLAVFNLIPAFPMDGGRVFRALLSLGMTRLNATKVAVNVGTVLAIVGGFAALRIPSISLMLVAGVVFVLGRAELAAVRVEEARKEWRKYFSGLINERPAGRVYSPAGPW